MARGVVLVLFMSLFSVAACGGGGGDSSSTESACGVIGLGTKIINGVSCDDLAAAPVVRVIATVEIDSDLFNVPVCTGSMITPDTVLTAAHCLRSRLSGYNVVNFGMYVGEPGMGDFVKAREILIAPNFRFDREVGRAFDDAALVKLVHPVSLPHLPILLNRNVEVGEQGFVYGYGATEAGDVEGSVDFFSLEAGAMTVENVTGDHIFVLFSGNGVNVCNGDSGGPLVLRVNGAPVVAGIVSQGSEEGCRAGDVTTFTNLQSATVQAWLQQHVAEAFVRAGE